MMFNNKHTLSIVGLLLIFCFYGCKTEVSSADDQHEQFIKTYSGQADEGFFSIMKLQDGGALIAGFSGDDANILELNRTNAYGSSMWRKTIQLDMTIVPSILELPDGSFLINSLFSCKMLKVTGDGDIVFDKTYDATFNTDCIYYQHSKVFRASNGKLHLSATNGSSSGSPSRNYISVLDDEGNETNSFVVPDGAISSKVLLFRLYEATDEDFWSCGNVFNQLPWSWSDRQKLYFAKVGLNNPAKVTILNPNDMGSNDVLIDYQKLPNKGVVALSALTSFYHPLHQRGRHESDCSQRRCRHCMVKGCGTWIPRSRTHPGCSIERWRIPCYGWLLTGRFWSVQTFYR
jgi:hypothetical protein